MSRHIDALFALIDPVLQERPGNDDGPETAAASDEEPSAASDGRKIPTSPTP